MSPLRQITDQLTCFAARPIDLGDLRPAAVLVPLFLRNGEPWVLLTLRPAHLKKHAGEICFPGGGVENQDSDFWQTALRETEEEVGIRAADVQRLGQLDDFYSIHGYRVKVCVGSFPGDYSYRPDRNEIDEIIQLPLARLRDPQVYHQEDWAHRGRMVPVDFYQVDGYNIWGMTAAVLKQLLERTGGVAEQSFFAQALS